MAPLALFSAHVVPTFFTQVAIASEADTGDSLADKVHAAMALPKRASVELYLSSDGTPIEAGATLAAQGIGDGAALHVVVVGVSQGEFSSTRACMLTIVE